MAIIDVTTFNGEYELFDLRYNILKDHVDEFIVCEFPTTFSGKEKPFYATTEMADKYPKATFKHTINDLFPPEDVALAENSPNTRGAAHWKHEFLQKESIKYALKHLNDDDIVFIGDVDEIWDFPRMFREEYAGFPPDLVLKLKLRVYTYWLNNRSSEEFWGPIVTKYKNVKGACLNHLRSTEHTKTDSYHGWHFTSMGGPERLRAKLTDSYTHESYASPEILAQLEYNMARNKDFLGRDFSYTLDESEWPEFLQENRDKYKHLIKDYA